MSTIVNTMNPSIIAKAIKNLVEINKFLIDVQMDVTVSRDVRDFAIKKNGEAAKLRYALEHAMKYDDIRFESSRKLWDIAAFLYIPGNILADLDEKRADVAIAMATKAKHVRRDVEQEVFALPGFRESLVA